MTLFLSSDALINVVRHKHFKLLFNAMQQKFLFVKPVEQQHKTPSCLESVCYDERLNLR